MDTDTAWELWAQRDPYYGVLTHPRFRADMITPSVKEEFLISGHTQVAHVLNVSRRVFDPAFAPQRVLDFGCGVGRTVIPFAAMASDVVGADVAPSMLLEARRNCDERRIGNASFVLTDDSLSALEGAFDLIHSSMVFQHIAPARGLRILSLLQDRLVPGGLGAVHLTFGLAVHSDTFGRPVPPPKPVALPLTAKARARSRQVLAGLGLRKKPLALTSKPAPNDDPEMLMHCYEMSDVLFLLQRAGIVNVFSEFVDHGGAIGVFLYFRKP